MKNDNLVAKILTEVAPTIGARVLLEPKWRTVGQITFASGRRRYFRYSTLDLNRVGASDIARDKDYSKFFLSGMGYPVVPGKAFCSSSWAKTIHSKEDLNAAGHFAKTLGWPVIVKPNASSQGRHVSKAHTSREFRTAFRAASQVDKMILVERFVSGDDYRIVVLDKEVISAYRRIPLTVTGDGRSTIRQLLLRKQKVFESTGRDTILNLKDPRILRKLVRRNCSLASKPADGEVVYCLDNANLSSGGDSIDVTNQLHAAYKRLAVQLTRDMGLRLCGVDLITKTAINAAPVEGSHWILEINAAPGLDHYASIGRKQSRVVERLYRQVLSAMDTDA